MKISVITVNRNNVSGLRSTIQSVIAQTAAPSEFIIIDGASIDGSAQLLQEYREYISYSISEPDNGIYYAMNKGIAQAHGDYCIFMNSGDCFASPDVLEKVLSSGASADIICGDAVVYKDKQERWPSPDDITLSFLYEQSICHQAAFIRRSLLEAGYDDSLKIVADRKFFLEALVFGGCSYAHINVDVVNYDLNGFSAQNRFASEQEWESVLRNMLPERILLDYGRQSHGALYGASDYERLFLEIGRRRWRTPVYRLVRGFLNVMSVFVPSARFVKDIKG